MITSYVNPQRSLLYLSLVGPLNEYSANDLVNEYYERHSTGLRQCILDLSGAETADGSGVNVTSYKVVRQAGVDVCTTGDHVYRRSEVLKLFRNEPERVLRPLNYPVAAAGRGLTVLPASNGTEIGVINLQGRVFMDPSDDPFAAATAAIAEVKERTRVILVDFHAEATSEKRAMAFFLDGKVSIVFGTHTHVPTADEEILPRGTAYVTDLGMSGPYRSVIGRRADRVIKSMTTKMYAPFDLADEDVRSTGILVDLDEETGFATSIRRVTLRLEDE